MFFVNYRPINMLYLSTRILKLGHWCLYFAMICNVSILWIQNIVIIIIYTYWMGWCNLNEIRKYIRIVVFCCLSPKYFVFYVFWCNFVYLLYTQLYSSANVMCYSYRRVSVGLLYPYMYAIPMVTIAFTGPLKPYRSNYNLQVSQIAKVGGRASSITPVSQTRQTVC